MLQQGNENPLRMVSFTMRVPLFLKQILQDEAHRRRSQLEPQVAEAVICREALKEWAEKRGLLPSIFSN